MRIRKNTRLKGYNYARPGIYLITICTQLREPYLGKCTNGKVSLSPIGIKAELCWNEIPEHFKHLKLGAHIIMPDHIHGILILNHHSHYKARSNEISIKFGPLPKGSIPVIIGHYKAAVTRWCYKNKMSYFAWQPRYYDHIISNQIEYKRLTNYILTNPLRWNADDRTIHES